MSRVTEISAKFNLIADQNSAIRKYVFDDVSALNSVHLDEYPLLMLKLPIRSELPDYKQMWETFDIEIFICEPRHQEETRTIEAQYDELKVICEDVIDEFVFYPNVYQLEEGVEFEYGHDKFITNLCIVQAKFKARVFNCRNNTASGEVVTIRDNDNALVGTVAARTSLQVIAKDTGGVEIDCTYTLSNGILTLSNINVIHMVQFTGVTTTLTNAAFAGKAITEFVVLISGTDWVTTGNATKVTASSTITLDTDVGGGIANVIY